MADWVYDSIVESGRDKDQSSGRKVFFARVLFKRNGDELCQTFYFFDVAPTNAQRNAVRDNYLEQLNATPVQDLWDEIKDLIQERVREAIRAGKTRNQILNAIQNALS